MNLFKSKQILTPLIHLMAWGLFFSIPFLTFWRDSYDDTGVKLIHNGVTLASLMLVFYINFFVLIEKFFFKHRTWEYFLYNVVFVFLLGYLVHLCKEALPAIHFNFRRMPPPEGFGSFAVLFFKDVFPLLITLALSIAVKVTSKWYDLEMKNQEAEKRRTEAELMNLKQQLNPHFLFNTLNNIYALIAISPDRAQGAVHDLSKLLRYVLYENNDQWVQLSNELDFVLNYIELMRIRLSSDVQLNVLLDSKHAKNPVVPPMIFISLVENAFKHGVSPNRKSFISIDIHVENEEKLVCLVTNSYFPKDQSDKSGSGIGIENLKRRLEILYPERYELNLVHDDFVYTSKLIINL